MDEVTGAVIAIAFGLSAVFVPTAFIAGISGQFYRQFALTIAVSTLLSAFNSLTLSPALCAILLQPHGARKDWFGRLWDFLFGWFFQSVQSQLRCFKLRLQSHGRLAASPRGLGRRCLCRADRVHRVWVSQLCRPGFIPAQDQGYLITVIQLPDGASLERTDEVVRRATEMILETPGVEFAVAFVGFSGATRANSPNAGAIFVGPKPFEERTEGEWIASDVLATLQAKLWTIVDADIFVIPPPPVQGFGTAGGFKFVVQDRAGHGARALQEATDELVAAARSDPALTGVFSTYRASTPQLYADVDRVKANMLNVPLANIFEALQVNLAPFTSTTSISSAARFRCAPRPTESFAQSRRTFDG